jgi:N-sulfoglucosamine sulfohydrolase
MLRINFLLLIGYLTNIFWACDSDAARDDAVVNDRFNILIAIADDISYPHMGIYGYDIVETPAFDRIARNGILFHNAFAPAPGCAPSRSSIHLGRYQWQNEEAGGHQTLFPLEYVVYPDVLEDGGYFIGHTGKGVLPFAWELSGRDRNMAGPAFSDVTYQRGNDPRPSYEISNTNYAANFEAFLSSRPNDQPFYFWYGAREPHRSYEDGSGLRSGKKLEDVPIPEYYPDSEVIRSDFLDYALEIEWFDRHLMKMIKKLEELGELENTLIIVTADQGKPFPRSKVNLYDSGLRVPLAVSWPERIKPGREVYDLISLADIAPTLLELTGISPEPMKPMSAKSFADILFSEESGYVDPTRKAVYGGRERHASARWANLGYPQRSVRTHDYLYIRNFTPERWPAGAPQSLMRNNPQQTHPMHGLDEDGRFTGHGYHDIDDSPTKAYLIENMHTPEGFYYYDLSMGKRPEHELFDVKNDPYNLHNLANDPEYADVLEEMRNKLMDFLTETGDPRVFGPIPDIFENYQRHARMRSFPYPDWVKIDNEK